MTKSKLKSTIQTFTLSIESWAHRGLLTFPLYYLNVFKPGSAGKHELHCVYRTDVALQNPRVLKFRFSRRLPLAVRVWSGLGAAPSINIWEGVRNFAKGNVWEPCAPSPPCVPVPSDWRRQTLSSVSPRFPSLKLLPGNTLNFYSGLISDH